MPEMILPLVGVLGRSAAIFVVLGDNAVADVVVRNARFGDFEREMLLNLLKKTGAAAGTASLVYTVGRSEELSFRVCECIRGDVLSETRFI